MSDANLAAADLREHAADGRTEFLAARLDEDEAAAKAAITAGEKRYGELYHKHAGFDPGGVSVDDGWLTLDPARMLRDVVAGRRLLDGYQRLLDTKTRHDKAAAEYNADVEQEERTAQDPGPGNLGTRGRALRREADYLDAMLPIMRRLIADRAAVYSDHPDYDAGWAP